MVTDGAAMINGKLLSVGGVIEEATLVKSGSGTVRLRFWGEEKTLRLGGQSTTGEYASSSKSSLRLRFEGSSLLGGGGRLFHIKSGRLSHFKKMGQDLGGVRIVRHEMPDGNAEILWVSDGGREYRLVAGGVSVTVQR